MVRVLRKPLWTKIQFPKLWWTVRAMLIALSLTNRQNKDWQSKSTFVTLITAHLFQMGFHPLKRHSWALTTLCGAAINTPRFQGEIWCNRNILTRANCCCIMSFSSACLNVFSSQVDLGSGISCWVWTVMWCMNTAKQTVTGSFTMYNAIQNEQFTLSNNSNMQEKHEKMARLVSL